MSNRQGGFQIGKENSSTIGGLVLATAIGSLIGAGVAMLFSPWRGAEARLRLKYQLKEFGTASKQKIIGLCRRRRGMRKDLRTHA